VESVSAEQAGCFELDWTGIDRATDHRAWAARSGGGLIAVTRAQDVIAAGAVMNSGPDRGIVHLALSPASDDGTAAGVVLLTLAELTGPPADRAHLCLPAPNPAVRALLASGWRFNEFDLFMATAPDLLDPRRAVPSPGQAYLVPAADPSQQSAQPVDPERMTHGYTHRTTRLGDVVTKVYQGPNAEAGCAREAAVLTAVAGLLPVPPRHRDRRGSARRRACARRLRAQQPAPRLACAGRHRGPGLGMGTCRRPDRRPGLVRVHRPFAETVRTWAQ
jgi:hypothetical protein